MSEKTINVGGQAIIEGVMMKSLNSIAIAVRMPDKSIKIETKQNKSITQKYSLLNIPILRGIIILIETLILGIKSLSFSANCAMEEEEEEFSNTELFFSIFMAFGVGFFLFIVLPAYFIKLISPYITSILFKNLIEGIVRIAIFISYVLTISRMDDIQRVFEYHGAEHKAVHTYENKQELIVANAKQFSPLHPRCGTSFLLLVMLTSVLTFSFLKDGDLIFRILSRLTLMPFIAGLCYEFIKLSFKYQNIPFIKWVTAPGLYLQKLTTREPDEDQLEIALTALKSAIKSNESQPELI